MIATIDPNTGKIMIDKVKLEDDGSLIQEQCDSLLM